MSASITGVYPVHNNQFKVDVATSGSTASMKTIADMETFSVSFSNGVETWTPMESEGWQRALMTAKAITISLSGKRNVGDDGNDFVAGMAFKNGRAAQADFEWTFADGTTVAFADAVFDVKNAGAGGSTDVAPLEFDVISNGKPTVTPAT